MLLKSVCVVIVMLLASQGYCAETAQAPKEFGGIIAAGTSMSAVVEAVDYTTRMVTLKNADGKEITFKAGPDVRNLAQVNKGDTVTIEYTERVQIQLTREETAPMRQESVDIARAPLGEKPAGIATSTTEIYAKVTAIDYEKRTVTLQGPQKSLTVKADENAPYFKSIKPGDTVYLEYTEQLAIAVTK